MLELYDKTEFMVDCGITVKKLLALGNYDSTSQDVTDDNFPPEVWETSAIGVVKFSIFHSLKAMEFEEVVMRLREQNCRGASLRQGLNFGYYRPGIHRQISLFLPGSFWRDSKTAHQTRKISLLSCISGTRHVYLRQLDQVHPQGTFFLATVLS